MYRLLNASEIDVRVGTVGAKGVTLLLYKDARVDMTILDEVHGSAGWQRDHKELKGNMYAGVGIWNDAIKEWVWKWDCGTESFTEKEKGEASDSFKRACFNVGIGRELYTAPFIFIPCDTIKKDRGYELVDKYQFNGCKVANIIYNADREIEYLEIINKQGDIIFPKFPQKPKAETKKIGKLHMEFLTKAIKETETDEGAFLTFMEIEKLEDMTIEEFTNKAKPALEKKKKKGKK